MTRSPHGPLRVGIGGPVGSGKTALVDRLCKRLRARYDLAVITDDIYTCEDAEFLTLSGALAPERIAGVETGGCPHTAIREDAPINLAAVERLRAAFPGLELVFIESGGDNLAATFSPELADLTIYVIDVDVLATDAMVLAAYRRLVKVLLVDWMPLTEANWSTMQDDILAIGRALCDGATKTANAISFLAWPGDDPSLTNGSPATPKDAGPNVYRLVDGDSNSIFGSAQFIL